MTKCIVFDFDGVLIDSKRMYVEFIHKALSENRIQMTFEDIDELLIPSIIETSKIVVPRQIKDREQVVKNIEQRVVELTATDGLDHISLAKDAKDTLDKLNKNENGYQIYLLTNSHSDFIIKALNFYQLEQYFHEVITLDSGFPSKDEAMKNISKTENCPQTDIVYIGDTKADVKLAHRVGCKILVVFTKLSWNFPNKQEILDLNPDLITDRLSEVPRLLDLIQNS